MTKEQANKHGLVMQWWINNPDKGVYFKSNGNWLHTLKPEFEEDFTYVQNDEYVEFRKALADGKTIEYKYNVNRRNQWFELRDLSPRETFTSEKKYRIKLELKKGDWVKRYYSNGQKECFDIKHVKYVDNESVEFTDGYCSYFKNNEKLQLWKPEIGEWCWYDDRLVQVIQIYVKPQIRFKKNNTQPVNFEDLIPFIGPLPEWTKEINLEQAMYVLNHY